MARKCKCHVTGEIGTTDTFIKIGNFYYKNQEVYDREQKKKDSYKALIDYICKEFLGYGNGQPFPPTLPKFLKELAYYDNDIILETFKSCNDSIHYSLNNKQFRNEYNKLAYMFAIVKNKIADVNEMCQYKKAQEIQERRVSVEQADLGTLGSKKKGKDISAFLEDDEF